MIQLFGTPRSSAGRCYLLLEELGLKYEGIAVDLGKRENRKPEFLKMNPNGKVPCLIDGDFVIWESLAINSYLAEKYKPEILGATIEDRALALQWSTWALTELQMPMIDLIIQTVFMPEDKRDHGVIARAQDKIPPALKILDEALTGRTYLVGSEFSIADLNVASVVNISNTVKVSLESYKNILPWMERIKNRPSFQKFLQMRAR